MRHTLFAKLKGMAHWVNRRYTGGGAGMVELVDTPDLGSGGRDAVGVQVPLPARKDKMHCDSKKNLLG